MFIIPAACILFGCLVDVPVIVGNGPLESYANHYTKSKKSKKKVAMACYVEGVFYEVCP